MKLVSLTIPEDSARLPGWLEQHLVGLELAALVSELATVHGAAGPLPGLADLLGDRREQVLTHGLAALPAEALRQLLRFPGLLLDLQELVLLAGGPYWERVSRPAGIAHAVERGGRRLGQEAVEEPAPVVLRMAWYRQPWVVSLATAAAVLVAVFLPRWLRPAPIPETGPIAVVTPGSAPGWGWDRPGALPDGGSAPDYFNTLASAAEEWFKKRPEDAAALARRLHEFRQGCTTLIFAGHKPLAEKDRLWLVERCRLWGAQIDQQLADLEAGSEVAVVRDQMDKAVAKMVAALRERGTTLKAG